VATQTTALYHPSNLICKAALDSLFYILYIKTKKSSFFAQVCGVQV
jgi:hypothetical protein